MFNKPRLKSSFDYHTLQGKYLFLMDEHQEIILEGDIYARLAPLLDGNNSIIEISKKLGGKISLFQIYYALNQLEKHGYIFEGDNNTVKPDTPFIEYFDGSAIEFEKRRESFTLEVRTVGDLKPDSMVKVLRANKLRVGEKGDFLVVLTDEYARAELDSINRECMSVKKPWMLVKPVGMVLWLGPVFQPGETGCWRCFYHRIKGNRQLERYIYDQLKDPDPVITSKACLPPTIELACNLAALEILKWLISPRVSQLCGKIVTIDLYIRETHEHILVKRPQCPVCGNNIEKKTDSPSPIQLYSRKKKYLEEGGHRTLTPEQTFSRYKHHISPITGAVTMLVPAFGAKSELTPSYVAGHNFSMGLDRIVFLRESLRARSGGKGCTKIQAKVSGLCEAIERYSGIYTGSEHFVRGTYTALKPKAIHPNDCMGFSEEQYRERHKWNKCHSESHCVIVPSPFDEDMEIDWTPIWSFTSKEFYYVPSAYCYYGHPEFRAPRWCNPDSNGTAAGNTLEEALLQGFMELVERDAVALWWYNRIKRPKVDLDSFKLPYIDEIRQYYTCLKRDIWVLDITSDLNIATFACISRRIDSEIEDIILGFGAHFDPKIALLRAVTEANQFLPSVSQRNPDGSTRYLFGGPLAKHWWTTAKLENQNYLLPIDGHAFTRYPDIYNPSSNDLLDDINTCIEIARKNNMEFLALDQTKPDIELNVVKVVIPQLCHFWRRLGKSRLYEAPVKMGWLAAPLSEDQINHYSIFF